jgi:hydroxymethylglutaryl-CoA lyase/(R)-citramalyl-CoA lyase
MTATSWPDRVQIVEVGVRDGLQNEPNILPPEMRAELVNRLSGAGLTRIEAVSFVSPARVPQMAGAEEVLRCVERRNSVSLEGLVLNIKGFERAVQAGVNAVRYAFPVSDEFARRNQNSTVQDGANLAQTIIERSRAAGVRVSIILSTAFGCPFEGRIPAARVLGIAERMLELAPDELILADTIGVGNPRSVRALLGPLRQDRVALGAHFHNTRNTGYANAVAAIESGACILDASVGGLGGCPFAPRATGNIATEDLVYLLREMGVDTGVNLAVLLEVSDWLEGVIGRPLPGLLHRAGDFAI